MKKLFYLILSIFILLTIGFGIKNFLIARQPKPVMVEPREEIDITIIPGWTIRQIASDWMNKGLIKNEEELYAVLGTPAVDYSLIKSPRLPFADEFPLLEELPDTATYEGFLMPDTYRVYADASLGEVLVKIFNNLEEKITPEMREEIKQQNKTIFEIMTMASIVEKEAGNKQDMAMVADIFWRRNKIGMALQSCATVNYITGKNDPGISSVDREIDSPYNTYMYPGLTPGPIANPGLTAIMATIYPEKNNYLYFMSGADGVTHYASTLEEHNANVWQYLR